MVASTPLVLGAIYPSTARLVQRRRVLRQREAERGGLRGRLRGQRHLLRRPWARDRDQHRDYQSEVATRDGILGPGSELYRHRPHRDRAHHRRHNVVYSETGSAVLTAGSQAGQTYVVVGGGGLSSYADIDAAYLGGGTPRSMGSSIPVADFTLHSSKPDRQSGALLDRRQ